MKKSDNYSRRNFLKKSGAGAGLIGLGNFSTNLSTIGSEKVHNNIRLEKRSPRVVRVLTVSKTGTSFSAVPFGRNEVVQGVIDRIRLASVYKPDIISIFELFNGAPPSEAQEVPGPLTNTMAELAKELNSYIICPLHTKAGSKVYNSAVLIDRDGSISGQYNKCHPVTGEIAGGVSPGVIPPPVFKTDFGTIGIQICFDVNWIDRWKELKDQGAEIVFWPSAYPGGRMLPAYAWMFKYYIVTSTWRDPATIYDMTGDIIASSGLYERWAFASLNMEKAFLETVTGYTNRLNDAKRKYGSKLIIKYYHDEDWTTIESNSPDLYIKDILKEYDLVPHWDYIKNEEIEQAKFR